MLWLQSPSAVILEPKKIKSVTFPTFYPSVCHEVLELDVSFLNLEFQISLFLKYAVKKCLQTFYIAKANMTKLSM